MCGAPPHSRTADLSSSVSRPARRAAARGARASGAKAAHRSRSPERGDRPSRARFREAGPRPPAASPAAAALWAPWAGGGGLSVSGRRVRRGSSPIILPEGASSQATYVARKMSHRRCHCLRTRAATPLYRAGPVAHATSTAQGGPSAGLVVAAPPCLLAAGGAAQRAPQAAAGGARPGRGGRRAVRPAASTGCGCLRASRFLLSRRWTGRLCSQPASCHVARASHPSAGESVRAVGATGDAAT